jgi:glyoxylase I family protein
LLAPPALLEGTDINRSKAFYDQVFGWPVAVDASASAGEPERAAAALDGAGVKHGEVKDQADAGIAILSFQDPDDINVELTAALG